MVFISQPLLVKLKVLMQTLTQKYNELPIKNRKDIMINAGTNIIY